MYAQVFPGLLWISVIVLIGVSAENMTDINMTVTVTTWVFDARVINESYTWFKAFNYCQEAGYGKAATAGPRYERQKPIIQFLRENNHSYPATFWTGHFRPYTHVDTWYNGPNCISSGNLHKNVPTADSGDRLCVAMTFGPNNYDFPTFEARDCGDNYSVLCYRYGYGKSKVNYTGYDLEISNETMTMSELSNKTDVECTETCWNDSNCAIYTLNKTSDLCKVYTLTDGYGRADVRLVYTGGNATYLVREGAHNISYGTFSLTNDVSTEFPECNISAIPDNYCPCPTPQPTTIEFEVLLKEMTVDPASTSKSKQKYISAEDHRVSSKAYGYVGLTIIIGVVGGIVFPDGMALVVKIRKMWKKYKRHKQQTNTEIQNMESA